MQGFGKDFFKMFAVLYSKYYYTNVMHKRTAGTFVHSWQNMDIGTVKQQALFKGVQISFSIMAASL